MFESKQIRTVVGRTVRLLLAIVFVGAGYKKLTDDPVMILLFQQIGFGKWFQYVTGIIEVAAALLLLLPSTVFIGGLLVAGTMSGAALVNLFTPGIEHATAKFVLAAVLLAAGAAVAWTRRPKNLKPSF